MKNKNWMKHGITLTLVLGFGLLAIGSATTDSSAKTTEIVYAEIPFAELEQAISNVNAPGHGFIVEAYLEWGGSFRFSETLNGTPSEWFHIHDDGYFDDPRHFTYVEPHQFEIYNNQTYKRIDATKKHKIYIGVYKHSSTKEWVPFIDKIEGLMTMDEVSAFEAQQKAEQTAAAEAKKKAEAEALEAKQNPNKLDRSLYREITAEDFSFDMMAGKLPVGSKVGFKASFFTKPTGTNYRFDDVNLSITLSTNHNFVRDIPDRCFGPYQDWIRGWKPKDSVKIFVTVKKSGESGECSVDIIEW